MAHNIIIIGAGIGGLAAAIRLQAQGHQVSVYEAGTKPGGKLNQFFQDGFRFDAGPSLFTLPEQVEELFSLAGKNAQEEFPYESLPIITRYQYEDGTVLHAWADPKA
ncbi:MAG: FAD-dependent oxidoreductase, partial [Bacteroidota bacterium]